MATIIFDDLRDSQLGNPTHSVVDFDTDDIRPILLDATDSGTIVVTMVDYAEVNTNPVAEGTNLASKTVGTVAVGVFDADNYTFPTVSGDAADYLILKKQTGTPTTEPLIVCWDSSTAGIPVTPNGGDIIASWHASGILQN